MNFISFSGQNNDEQLFYVSSIPHQQQLIQDTTDNNIERRVADNKRKIVNRDVERLRRQGMNTLHTTLRSLLPLQYLKGKRSISEIVIGATNYIKHQERKIQELRNKRDKLRKLFNSSTSTLDNVTVQRSRLGLEVAISRSKNDGVMPVSRVLEVLVTEGFGVESCVSTRANGRLVHIIKSEVMDSSRIDVHSLQQKVLNLVLDEHYTP